MPKHRSSRRRNVKKNCCWDQRPEHYPTSIYNGGNQLEERLKQRQRHWTHEEDKTLLSIVKTHGPQNWEKISTFHPTRNGKQMRERWLAHLKGVNKTQFSDKEVATVYYMHDIEKKGWVEIANKLGNNRTSNSCKNVYHNIVYKKLCSYPKAANEYKALYFATLMEDLNECSPKEKMAIEFLITAKNPVENKMDIKTLLG
ncbi:3063_t:CDS:2 [Paraglomus occultum]|uniref:3063_t:CDS:1 n=1 Tax=Paraglomus occultum TaxID=144539 RepID=A0A9N8ZCK6_9GLOM|nr:3063_t:CDS:2 [Paraglomus occultum]